MLFLGGLHGVGVQVTNALVYSELKGYCTAPTWVTSSGFERIKEGDVGQAVHQKKIDIAAKRKSGKQVVTPLADSEIFFF